MRFSFDISVLFCFLVNGQELSSDASSQSSMGWSDFWDYALDEEGPAGHSHAHNDSLDGHCIGCVGARRIFCMDGDENN